MRRAAVAAGFSLLWAWSACGGKATVDGSSGDGAGGTSSTGTTTNSTSTTSGPSVTTGGPGGGAPNTPCRQACSDLYDCGLQGDANGQQLCPGFTGTESDKSTFMYGGDGGCVDACDAQPVIAMLVDPNDCPGTISVFKGANADFADVCENGF